MPSCSPLWKATTKGNELQRHRVWTTSAFLSGMVLLKICGERCCVLSVSSSPGSSCFDLPAKFPPNHLHHENRNPFLFPFTFHTPRTFYPMTPVDFPLLSNVYPPYMLSPPHPAPLLKPSQLHLVLYLFLCALDATHPNCLDSLAYIGVRGCIYMHAQVRAARR